MNNYQIGKSKRRVESSISIPFTYIFALLDPLLHSMCSMHSGKEGFVPSHRRPDNFIHVNGRPLHVPISKLKGPEE